MVVKKSRIKKKYDDKGIMKNALRWSKKEMVFEKLSQTHKPEYIEVARIIKELEERKKCTFKPQVN